MSLATLHQFQKAVKCAVRPFILPVFACARTMSTYLPPGYRRAMPKIRVEHSMQQQRTQMRFEQTLGWQHYGSPFPTPVTFFDGSYMSREYSALVTEYWRGGTGSVVGNTALLIPSNDSVRPRRTFSANE